MSPYDDAVRVIWGKHPTLLLGGIVNVQNYEGQVNQYDVSITTEPWIDPQHATSPNEVMYDIHLADGINTRRYAVCAGTIFTAQSMGRLTTEKFVQEGDSNLANGLIKLLKGTVPSEESTATMQARLGAWGIVDAPSAIDEAYPDSIGAYYYMDTFYQEQQEQQE
jgi:hypothetical protein